MTHSGTKILPYRAAVDLSRVLKSGSFKVVITNGCFDVLHLGHVRYLEAARMLGDQLIVGVNADWAVKALKGPGRPLNNTQDRMAVLAALDCVSYVVPLDMIRVDIFIQDMAAYGWVKGGDYSIHTLDPGEVKAANDVGTKIAIIPSTPGFSTTELLRKAKT